MDAFLAERGEGDFDNDNGDNEGDKNNNKDKDKMERYGTMIQYGLIAGYGTKA